MWQQQAYLKATNANVNDSFGVLVSISDDGNTLAVAASGEDSASIGVNADQGSNARNNSGAVYIFTNDDDQWQQQAYLKASNTGDEDAFSRIALSGDGNNLAVGAPGEDSPSTATNGSQFNNSVTDAGAVYVFTRTNGNWQQQAYLKASNANANDRFGQNVSLSVDGNTLAVGAIGESSAATGIDGDMTNNQVEGAGAVYIFERGIGSWQERAYLKASNTDANDGFGGNLSLSADGETLAVVSRREGSSTTGINGDQNDNSLTYAGAVYIFEKRTGSWQQQAYIKSSNTEQADFFGQALDISDNGNTVVVGALLEDSAAQGINGDQFSNAENSSGAAYIFERNNGEWRQQVYLKASNTGPASQFYGASASVSGDGNTVAVGATDESSNAREINGDQDNTLSRSSGAIYLY